MPVIMISSYTQNGAKETIRALELGAFDFVAKPAMTLSYSLNELRDELLGKLRAAVQAKAMRRTIAIQQTSPKVQAIKKESPQTSSLAQIVAIGTSTGGPGALHELMGQMPGNLNAAIVIVQHMPANFTRSLAERLHTISALNVKEAEQDDILLNGHVYIAPGGFHMTLRFAGGQYRIQLDQEPPISGHRPSVNKMFESLINFHRLKRHIVLMTGMGNDGASAMLKLKQSGANTTIAESEKTCVVYGMPKAAVQLNAAQHVLALPDIAKKIIEVVNM
jgi:two-component system chemotaxis response regulator CheB